MFETTILRIKIRIKNPDCVTKALFSNISNITFVQILVIYLYTSMHCYLLKYVTKQLLPLLMFVPTITQ